MIGQISYARQKGKTVWSVTPLGMLSVGSVTLYEPDGLPRWRLERRIRKIERLFRKNGVRRIILPDDFPYKERLADWGRIGLLPFYRSIADLLVLASLKSRRIDPGKAVVLFSAPRMCPELRQAADRLCPAVRGVAVNVPEGGERYAVWLHRQYGIPIRPADRADVTVAFGPGGPEEGGRILLYEGGLSLDGLEVTAPGLDLPEDGRDQLLAALWECGSLERKSLEIVMRNTP